QEFLLAIRYFGEANALAPYNANVIFNLALAESKVPGREVRSMAWFEAYLATDPQAANANLVRQQISALEIKVEAAVDKVIASAKQLAGQRPFSTTGYGAEALSDVAEAQALSGDVAGAKQIAGGLEIG